MAVEYARVAQAARRPEGRQLADALRSLRIDAALTQEEAAQRIGLTLSGYRTYEQGKRHLRVDQIPKFAEAFEVTIPVLAVRLWPEDMLREVQAMGFRPDEAALVAEIARDLAQRTPRQRQQILTGLRLMLQSAAPDND